MNSINIIIPFKSDLDTLIDTLIALNKQSILSPHLINLSVTIVDDRSGIDLSILSTLPIKYSLSYCKNTTIDQISGQSIGGPGIARSLGLLHCNSDYVLFLDSDDYLYDKALELMINVLESDPSIVKVSGILRRDYYKNDELIVEYHNALESVYVVGVLYRTSFLKKYRIDFSTSISYYAEDAYFCKLVNGYIYFTKSKSVELDELIYYNRANPNSFSRYNDSYKFNSVVGAIKGWIAVLNQFIRVVPNQLNDPYLIGLANQVCIFTYYKYCEYLVNNPTSLGYIYDQLYPVSQAWKLFKVENTYKYFLNTVGNAPNKLPISIKEFYESHPGRRL